MLTKIKLFLSFLLHFQHYRHVRARPCMWAPRNETNKDCYMQERQRAKTSQIWETLSTLWMSLFNARGTFFQSAAAAAMREAEANERNESISTGGKDKTLVIYFFSRCFSAYFSRTSLSFFAFHVQHSPVFKNQDVNDEYGFNILWLTYYFAKLETCTNWIPTKRISLSALSSATSQTKKIWCIRKFSVEKWRSLHSKRITSARDTRKNGMTPSLLLLEQAKREKKTYMKLSMSSSLLRQTKKNTQKTIHTYVSKLWSSSSTMAHRVRKNAVVRTFDILRARKTHFGELYHLVR